VKNSEGEGYYRSDSEPDTTPRCQPLEALSSMTIVVFGLVMFILGLILGAVLGTLLILP
jgi:hypothetical protein